MTTTRRKKFTGTCRTTEGTGRGTLTAVMTAMRNTLGRLEIRPEEARGFSIDWLREIGNFRMVFLYDHELIYECLLCKYFYSLNFNKLKK